MTENHKVFTNRECEYFPCHNVDMEKYQFNCMFCFCPLYYLKCNSPYQKWIKDNNNNWIKDCGDCDLPHLGKQGYKFVINNINNPFEEIKGDNQ